ncbi:N-acetylmuramoyl-L-alanine amidase [Actinomadura sp. ATCC 31491]|uniref:N-acetylmuramoyl-L-alanine amidase n=1 Tax=Actinomadura luzonensis TaxID=2805427 RepID=A0ABT0FZ09_9ACTN|nr:peptidoglycan recognition family protein [Actinomadura luzonensis]MCK2217123.1 N-acetylmuramoyl-L-alanine amidase [Actinomadura luzonensis]
MHFWLACRVTLAAVLAAGTLTAPGTGAARELPAGRQGDFAAAAREFGVPESVLLGVAYLGSRWDAHAGRPSTAGGYGPMHLVDALPAAAFTIGDALGDARGDDSRPMPPRPAVVPGPLSAAAEPQNTTLPEAGRLIGVDPARLRDDPAANIRAGAALLASYRGATGGDPADWYDAVARFSGADDPAAARQFADEVFAVIREGMRRRTDDGYEVRLDPVPGLMPPRGPQTKSAAELDPPPAAPAPPVTDYDAEPPEPAAEPSPDGSGTFEPGELGAASGRSPAAECPASLACEWMPAAFKRFGKKGNQDYGNHDRLYRTRTIDYIVVHDTEGGYQGIPSMIRNPKYVSWHYTIRSRDGHVAQHVKTNDLAWHAGNWDVNTRSIGVEHEGYLAKGGAWYTEAMYRASAKLVRYLADKHGVPLNRAHILGHDNVPGTTPKTVAGMHEDPGPYWDWAHYFELMGRPFKGVKDGGSVLIRPSYDDNRPRFTGCVTTKAGKDCPPHGAATVWLHTAPSDTAALVADVGKHGGKASSYSVYDHAARASTGQRFAVADRQGDWTAIWYLGQKAWFRNPADRPAAVPAKGPLVTPLRAGTKVYGRAYPEKSAYTRAAAQPLTPLQYRIGPGQTYTVGDTITGSYYAAGAFSASRHVTTTGTIRYHQIQLGHRIAFVMAKDVRLVS